MQITKKRTFPSTVGGSRARGCVPVGRRHALQGGSRESWRGGGRIPRPGRRRAPPPSPPRLRLRLLPPLLLPLLLLLSPRVLARAVLVVRPRAREPRPLTRRRRPGGALARRAARPPRRVTHCADKRDLAGGAVRERALKVERVKRRDAPPHQPLGHRRRLAERGVVQVKRLSCALARLWAQIGHQLVLDGEPFAQRAQHRRHLRVARPERRHARRARCGCAAREVQRGRAHAVHRHDRRAARGGGPVAQELGERL